MENDEFLNELNKHYDNILLKISGIYAFYLEGANKTKEILNNEIQKVNDYANTTNYLLEKANERIAEEIKANHETYLQFEILRVENKNLKKDVEFYRAIVETIEMKNEA